MSRPSPGSFIDSVDEFNRPMGIVQRSSALELGANFRTVHVFVFDHVGDLLLQQLSPTRERHPLLWGSSVAGYLYAGETYETGARRRLAEEVGLSSPIHWRGVAPMRDEMSNKFVGLFTTTADNPVIGEPDHIAALEWRGLNRILDEVADEPDRFTPTLRRLLDYYTQLLENA
jgi:isopentenyl-diphosphate delta-isomerase